MICSAAGAFLALASPLAGAGPTTTAADRAADKTPYVITARWPVGGPGGWDYLTLDQPRHRLFVARGDRVDVIDIESGKVAGRISGTAGVHGVALAPRLRRGFTSNGRANSVIAFELDALKPSQEIRVSGLNPDAIYYDEPSQRVFTFNAKSSNATVLDAQALGIVGTIALAGPPEFAAGDGHGRVYVNIATDPGQIQVIDSRSLALVATWTLPGCVNPTGLAIDAAGRRLFSACENKQMVVTDAATGRRVTSARIGEDPDAIAIDGTLGLVFVSSGASGTLNVMRLLDADHLQRLADVRTQLSARTLALDTATHRIYLAAATYEPASIAAADQPPRIVPDSFAILVAEPGSPAAASATPRPKP